MREARSLVLQLRPVGTDGWSEDRLAEIVTRDSMIAVALVETSTHGVEDSCRLALRRHAIRDSPIPAGTTHDHGALDCTDTEWLESHDHARGAA